MAERIFEVEHQPGEGLVLRFKSPVLSLLPEPTRGHFRAARKELLLALRSLLDDAIKQIEKAEKTKPKTKIEIQ